jgi:hypothetical protein
MFMRITAACMSSCGLKAQTFSLAQILFILFFSVGNE